MSTNRGLCDCEADCGKNCMSQGADSKENTFVNINKNIYDNDESGLTHECGVFAAMASGSWPTNIDIAQVLCLGLVSLQHRGQESAGIATSEGVSTKSFNVHKGIGLIGNVFNDVTMKPLRGNLGIGHTRYATSGDATSENVQPFVVEPSTGAIAIAHNGQLVNQKALRRDVQNRGIGLARQSDTELIAQLLCRFPNGVDDSDNPDWPARIRNFMSLTRLSYALVMMYKDRIYAVRDPHGNRPFCLGELLPVDEDQLDKKQEQDDDDDEEEKKLTNGNSSNTKPKRRSLNGAEEPEGWVVASESCGFLSIGARYLRELLPGEILELTRAGPRTVDIVSLPVNLPPQPSFCIFEYVYFARADSRFEGQMVYTARYECGRQLYREHPVVADIVGSVPESGTAAALGFAAESGIKFVDVLCRNRYVGRTFIQPTQRLRRLGIAKKFGALADNVAGKRVVLVDDSIVRGNTIGPICKLIRDAGALEVHVRIASPPILHPCFMGINIPDRKLLIATSTTPDALAQRISANSLAYLSIDGLVRAVRLNRKLSADNNPDKDKGRNGYCTACLSGEYPEQLPNDSLPKLPAVLQW